MTTYTIGQVAEQTGFSASALRYYERHGLVEPVDRTESGYRVYDETSIARLRFVARAKHLGCSLEEIADLAVLWADDDCAPVQRRLHALVTQKISDAQQRTADLIGLTAQLQTAAAHLGGAPADGACGTGCACMGGRGAVTGSNDGTRPNDEAGPNDTQPSPSVGPVSVVLGRRADPAIACTLPADDLPGRQADWAGLLDHVTARESLPDAGTGTGTGLGPGPGLGLG